MLDKTGMSNLESELTFLEVERDMPLMKLPLRSIVISMSNARILFSPASTLGPERLREAGAITDVVAPNLLHLAGMQAAAEAYPEAKLWGPPGASDKLPALAWRTLDESTWPFAPELQLVELRGMPRVREFVLLHRASRSLLVTDLVFNIERPRGLGAWVFLHLFGTYDRFGASRLFMRMVKDKASFQASLRQLQDFDFEHVVPAHGAIVSSDAKRRLLAALRERGL